MTPDQAKRAQSRLGVTADGIFGRNSWRALFQHMGAATPIAVSLARGANVHLKGIDETPLRIAHFIAQAAHESGGFKWLNEIWGPTPAQARYEGRKDLGNFIAGDGRRFAGRGIFQLTGRANYEAMANALGLDLVDHPELAAMPAISVLIAARYWNDRNLSRLADADNLEAITRAINGGVNGLADRRERLAKAKALLL